MSIGSKIMHLQVGDEIRINNWTEPFTVCGVSESYVLAHCGQEFTVIGKKPTREFRNGIPYVAYVCGPDYFDFGYPGGYDFENEEWVSKYLGEFDRGSIEMSVKHRAQIISLEREEQPLNENGCISTPVDKLQRVELKPCPFCGGNAVIIKIPNCNTAPSNFATCTNCGAEMPRLVQTEAKAAAAWNLRVW